MCEHHYVKFEYIGVEFVEVTDYTQITQCSKGGVDVIMSELNTPKNIIKYPIYFIFMGHLRKMR